MQWIFQDVMLLTDCYVWMPRDPPPVHIKVEMLLELHEEEAATLEPTFPIIDSQLPH